MECKFNTGTVINILVITFNLFSYMVALNKSTQKRINKPLSRLCQISSRDNVFKHYMYLQNKYHNTHFMHSLHIVHKICVFHKIRVQGR
jgi:hypothetical protein